jgi:hypothetical protein
VVPAVAVTDGAITSREKTIKYLITTQERQSAHETLRVSRGDGSGWLSSKFLLGKKFLLSVK